MSWNAPSYRTFLCDSFFFSWCACNLNICLTLQMRLIIFTINTGVPSQIEYKNVYKHRYIFWWYSNTNFSGGRSYLGYVLTSALGAKISLVNIMENGESVPYLHIMEDPLNHPNVKSRCSCYGRPRGTEMGREQKTHSSYLTLTSGHRSTQCGSRWRKRNCLFKLLFLSPFSLLLGLVCIFEFALLSVRTVHFYWTALLQYLLSHSTGNFFQ